MRKKEKLRPAIQVLLQSIASHEKDNKEPEALQKCRQDLKTKIVEILQDELKINDSALTIQRTEFPEMDYPNQVMIEKELIEKIREIKSYSALWMKYDVNKTHPEIPKFILG